MLPILSLAAACDEAPTPSVCSLPTNTAAIFAPSASVQITVVDSASGNTLLPGAGGWWITGAQGDSLRHWGNTLAALGPAGRYSVVVQAPGYRPWARSDIRVHPGDCGPETESLTARLQPE